MLATTDAEYWQDPHAALRAARASGNVARSPWGGLVLLDYDDCIAALSDPRYVNDYDALLTRNDVYDGPLWDWWQLAMLNNNPPVHTRLRSLVNRAFTPRSVVRAVGADASHHRRDHRPRARDRVSSSWCATCASRCRSR